ncbi:DNA-deoxyinosine glycosylase [Gracilibacillus oryzae]|uniref:DNA-deoxyinosine glycosylase n=1 Tax=Gracilibacillus oryzae TaxID=1672701 RepID=A0A7C8GQS4_9BACI|nr:DNA-deoxyinosine glycosylase [Gracilibacillus oryzae]KAB8126582.1 DNA-deoxyinosine glycosylase [Gracilibacillus oryzae]
MNNQKIYALDPIIDKHSRILILGSIPGRQSLIKQQYYGNKQNHFWPILFTIFDQEEIESYDEKIEFLQDKRIALWDTIGSCYREGSLDSKIIEAEPNPLHDLLSQYPNIQKIGCNGVKSYQTFQKHFPHLMNQYDVRKLPSSSPIPGRYTKTFQEKVAIWKELIVS